MGSDSGNKKTSSPAKRILPALLIPFFVGVCELNVGISPTPYVAIALAVGIAISVIVPRGWPTAAASLIAVALILSSSYIQELESSQAALPVPSHIQHAGPLRGIKHGGLGKVIPHGSPANVHLETMSVVLPCAFEGGFAEKTVEAILGNTNMSRLSEIIVVDDGSHPPLSTIWPERYGKSTKPVIKIVRHERTEGLISAKKSGGDAAAGDVIVFFDCHISPRRGWEEAFITQMKRAGDHKTVVVPTITSLDPDTWIEIPNGPSSKACFTLLNADFTWLPASGRDVPLMSGGLLALSRQWWKETGGYDEHMVAWGGENIDQSLRTWLCGGRIEAAAGAYVAHMWRDPKKPQTMLRYPIPTKDVMRNKARAVTAWFDGFREKVFTFPEYEDFVSGAMSVGDMSNFNTLKSQLTCAPFANYINRFSYVYLDGGLIPQEVFQLKEERSGFCLERRPQASPPHQTVLAPCAGQDEGGNPGSISELQLWHGANRDRGQTGAPCCSGLMNWNFFTCLDAQGVGARVRTYECQINGGSMNQAFQLDDAGRLLYRNNERRKGRPKGGCVAPEAPVAGHAVFSDDLNGCSVAVEAADKEEGTFTDAMGAEVPRTFRLRSEKASIHGSCAVAAQVTEDKNGMAPQPGWKMSFQKCNPHNEQEIFYLKPQHGGYQVHVGDRDSGFCLDSAGGSTILVYPCYADKDQNFNQVWHIKHGHLVWHPKQMHDQARALEFQVAPTLQKNEVFEFHMATCSDKKGQRIRKHDVKDDGSFILRDEDANKCLGDDQPGGIDNLHLGACDSAHRFTEDQHRHTIKLVGTDRCLDANDYELPHLMPCHGGKTQRFKVDDKAGWVKVRHAWEDNGRRRFYERCLDSNAEIPLVVSVQPCDASTERGIRWTRINARVPIETEVWNKAPKPAPDAPMLGGDAEPPS